MTMECVNKDSEILFEESKNLFEELRPWQWEHLKTIRYLVSAPRNCGRTYTICIATVLTAIEHYKKPIAVFDHHFKRDNIRQVLHMCKSIVEQKTNLECKISEPDMTITITGIKKEEV
jgi:hypothetical protein